MDHEASETAKFPLGHLVATPNALAAVTHDEMMAALGRHLRGDWGTLGKEDWAANDRALADEGRLFSAYATTKNVKFWIITECDRSVTTVLLPGDY
jgi:hypothetical protein